MTAGGEVLEKGQRKVSGMAYESGMRRELELELKYIFLREGPRLATPEEERSAEDMTISQLPHQPRANLHKPVLGGREELCK